MRHTANDVAVRSAHVEEAPTRSPYNHASVLLTWVWDSDLNSVTETQIRSGQERGGRSGEGEARRRDGAEIGGTGEGERERGRAKLPRA